MNKLEDITLFFCDIYGTIDSGFSLDECKEFATLLEELIVVNGSKYLMFAMASTEDEQVVDDYEEKITKYFENNIKILPKLPDNHILNEAKVSFIINYIKYILKSYNIKEIYLADDSLYNHMILEEVLKSLTNVDLVSIMPKTNENRLEYINNSILDIINNKKNNR